MVLTIPELSTDWCCRYFNVIFYIIFFKIIEIRLVTQQSAQQNLNIIMFPNQPNLYKYKRKIQLWMKDVNKRYTWRRDVEHYDLSLNVHNNDVQRIILSNAFEQPKTYSLRSLSDSGPCRLLTISVVASLYH